MIPRTVDQHEILWTLTLLLAFFIYVVNLRHAWKSKQVVKGFGLLRDRGIAHLFSFFLRQEWAFIICSVYFTWFTVISWFTVVNRAPCFCGDPMNDARLITGSLIIPLITFIQMGASLHARLTREHLMTGK